MSDIPRKIKPLTSRNSGCCTSDSEDCKSSAGSETEDEKLATSRLEVFIFDIFSVTSGNFCQIAAIGTVTAAVKRMTAKLENFESMFNATNKPGNDFEACEEQGVARKWKKETSADHTPLNINSITGSRKVKMLVSLCPLKHPNSS